MTLFMTRGDTFPFSFRRKNSHNAVSDHVGEVQFHLFCNRTEAGGGFRKYQDLPPLQAVPAGYRQIRQTVGVRPDGQLLQ